jgi:hypothetical protein
MDEDFSRKKLVSSSLLQDYERKRVG